MRHSFYIFHFATYDILAINEWEGAYDQPMVFQYK